MSLVKLSEKTISTTLLDDAFVVITQKEKNDDGDTVESVRRMPLIKFMEGVGYDLKYDEDNSVIYLLDKSGDKIGDGVEISADDIVLSALGLSIDDDGAICQTYETDE